MSSAHPPDLAAIEVSCYAGFRGEERPVSFRHGDRAYAVTEVLDVWYESGPERGREVRRLFKVRLATGETVLLDHHEGTGTWRFLRLCAGGGR